jgi:hypothetical protein
MGVVGTVSLGFGVLTGSLASFGCYGGGFLVLDELDLADTWTEEAWYYCRMYL